jgi:hypothetical protein
LSLLSGMSAHIADVVRSQRSILVLAATAINNT